MTKVAFFSAKKYDEQSFNNTLAELQATNKFPALDSLHIDYNWMPLNLTTVDMVRGYTVICAFVNDDLSAPVIEALAERGVQLVVLRCAGFNNVDLLACAGKITVLRVPAYSPYAVAEHALALLMTVNRQIHRAYNRTRETNFSIEGLQGMDLYGKTAGIIGTGKIGQIFAAAVKGIGMKVIAYDRFPNQQWATESGARYVELQELYKSADVISLHCPLTPETEHLIDYEALMQMKSHTILINTSRGKIINTPALIYAIKNHKIGAAALDVYEEEGDFFFKDLSTSGIADDVLSRLLSFPNVIVTAHQAFLTREALANIAQTTLENINAFFTGQELVNVVR